MKRHLGPVRIYIYTYIYMNSEEPPEPNIVWSCQTMRWEDDRDLHGLRR